MYVSLLAFFVNGNEFSPLSKPIALLHIECSLALLLHVFIRTQGELMQVSANVLTDVSLRTERNPEQRMLEQK